MVGLVGNAPTTFPMSRERSTSDLKAHDINIRFEIFTIHQNYFFYKIKSYSLTLFQD
jgi:hypothetical protein